MFDSTHRRTCLHYAAYYGHSDCLQAILSAAHTTPVSDSWLVNLLFFFFFFKHLPSSIGLIWWVLNLNWMEMARGFARFVNIRDGDGSTPLHLSARQSQPECVRILLSNGALVCVSTCRYEEWSLILSLWVYPENDGLLWICYAVVQVVRHSI